MKKWEVVLNWLDNTIVGSIATVLSFLTILSFGFSNVFKHPNGFLFASDGDGLKNYFNFGYYLKYDEGLSFSGVNYPYGEHLLYTDSHPILAFALNLVDDHLFEVASNAVAILNLSILLGMTACPVVLYLIFRNYDVRGWYAIIVAIGIALLSPQWSRIHGHLSLSYGFIFPLFFLLFLKVKSHNGKRWFWFLLLYLILIGGIHLYYVAICSCFLLAYVIVSWISHRSSLDIRESKPLSNLKVLVLVLAPLVLYQLIPLFSDTVADRPGNPYGFFTYHATWGSVFLPYSGPLKELLDKLVSPVINWEGRAYVGGTGLLFFILIGTGALRMLLQKHFQSRWVLNRYDSILLVSSVLVLLFSMCIPFEWGLQFIPEIISPLKQFRALGRFSWVFFYVVNVFAAIYLFRWTKGLSPLLFLCSLVWLVEGTAYYMNRGPIGISTNDKLENKSESYLERFSAGGQSVESFQGIFNLPLVAMRTDKMSRDHDLTAYNEALKCAWHTGLPLVQSTASRPSFSQSFSSIQMIAGPSFQKDRLKDMDQRPLVLLYAKESRLNFEEKLLYSQSEIFYQDDFIELRKLPLASFSCDLMEKESQITWADEEGGVSCYPNCNNVIWKDYDLSETTTSFSGSSALHSKTNFTLVDTSLSGLEDSASIEISFWVYIDPSYSGMPRYSLTVVDDSGKERTVGPVDLRHLTEIDRGWARVNISPVEERSFKVMLHGKNITVDNLLIKPVSTQVMINVGTGSLFNNYWLE